MGRRSPGGERVQNAAAAADSVMNIDDPVPSVAAAAHGAWRPQHDAHDETTRRAAQPNSRAVAPPPRRCRRCCCSCRYCRWPVKPPNEVGQWAAAPRHKCYPHTDDCMTVRARGGHSLCVIHERGQAFECSHSALAIPQCEPVAAMLTSETLSSDALRRSSRKGHQLIFRRLCEQTLLGTATSIWSMSMACMRAWLGCRRLASRHICDHPLQRENQCALPTALQQQSACRAITPVNKGGHLWSAARSS
jgi:hypothetical protein